MMQIITDIKEEILPEIEDVEEQDELELIPEKSKDAYCKEYDKLMTWMKSKNYTTVNESMMLAYMLEKSQMYKSSTLWCIHSKLQAMLRIKDGVDLASFRNLHAYMKGANKGYEANKSLVFAEEELRRFFVQAPDDSYLFLKVVTICGVFGSCRRYEMCDLRISDIKREGSVLIINIRPSKTEKGRKFVVVDDSGISYVQLFNKYLSLRPDSVATDRVFLKYANGKCTKQVVGINTFGNCPSRVARYLNLPDSDKYTGHAFRRTSATIMANNGMSADEIKRQIGRKSSMVAVGYIEESTINKMNASRRIDEDSVASISSINAVDVQMFNENKEDETSNIQIQNDIKYIPIDSNYEVEDIINDPLSTLDESVLQNWECETVSREEPSTSSSSAPKRTKMSGASDGSQKLTNNKHLDKYASKEDFFKKINVIKLECAETELKIKQQELSTKMLREEAEKIEINLKRKIMEKELQYAELNLKIKQIEYEKLIN